jgi:plastocyanin
MTTFDIAHCGAWPPRARRTRAPWRPLRRAAAAALAGALLAAPASAIGAVKTVRAGPPVRVQPRFDAVGSDALAFFPKTVTIHAGDAVRFVPGRPRALGPPLVGHQPARPNIGFHTVDIPPRGGRPLALVIPNAARASDQDSAGARFWFRGFDTIRLNPLLQKVPTGKVLSYDGRGRRVSGVLTDARHASTTVRFTRAGTFTYYCNLHLGMKGTVRVLPRDRRVPSLGADGRAVAAQVRRAIGQARVLAGRSTAPRVVSVGQAGGGGVQRYRFVPNALTVPKGRTITFKVPAGSLETHTVTTGPGDPLREPDSYLGRLAASIKSAAPSPVATYASDPPTVGAVSLTPTLHGNGFWNSGVLGAAEPRNSVQFTQQGRYSFYCLLHPFMSVAVTVR